MIYAANLPRAERTETPYVQCIRGGGRKLRLVTCPTCRRRLGYVYRDIDQDGAGVLLVESAAIQTALLTLLNQLTVMTFALDLDVVSPHLAPTHSAGIRPSHPLVAARTNSPPGECSPTRCGGCHPNRAGDVVAETFAATWRHIDRVPVGDGELPWLYSVAAGAVATSDARDDAAIT